MVHRREFVRASAAQEHSQTFSHPWNPKSQITGVQLGKLAGLSRTGVSLARVSPGRESFILHAHETEEEWIYVLSGSGTAIIGDQEVSVGPGDFMGFPTPSVPHHLRNDGTEDLVYLMGGEHHAIEAATFPGLGKTMLRVGDRVQIFSDADATPLE